MKLKENVHVTTDDFWYDLFYGGYIKPEKILVDKTDVKRVNDAIQILKEFKDAVDTVTDEM